MVGIWNTTCRFLLGRLGLFSGATVGFREGNFGRSGHQPVWAILHSLQPWTYTLLKHQFCWDGAEQEVNLWSVDHKPSNCPNYNISPTKYGISLTQLPFGVTNSCEIAITWLAIWNDLSSFTHENEQTIGNIWSNLAKYHPSKIKWDRIPTRTSYDR